MNAMSGFSVNSKFELRGRQFTISALSNVLGTNVDPTASVSGATALTVSLRRDDGQYFMKLDKDLVRYWEAGDLKFIGDDGKEVQPSQLNARLARREAARRLDLFTPKELARHDAREAYVKAILDDGGRPKPVVDSKKAIEKLAEELKAPKVPSYTTVRRWLNRYLAGNGKRGAIAGNFHRRGNRGAALSPQAESYIEEMLRRHVLVPNAKSIAACHRLMLGDLAEAPLACGTEVISEKQVRARYDRIPESEKVRLREGYKEYKRRFPNGTVVDQPKSLMERAEVDHTPLDVLVIDRVTGEVLGRPWLTLVIDCLSRMIIGFHISLAQPSAHTVKLAVRNAILSKDKLLEQYGLVGPYPCMGLFSELVVDNGKDFHAVDVQDALSRMGIVVRYNPPGRPNNKGKVERLFRSINEQLIHTLPGTTKSNYAKKGDYKSKQYATVSMEQLIELVSTWIVDVYHKTEHRTLKKTPLEAWNDALPTALNVRLPERIQDLDRLLWEREDRKLQKYGIEFDCLTYQSPELQDIAKSIKHGSVVEFFVDHEDISAIRVIDPETFELIEVPAVDQTYAQSVRRRFTHSQVKAQARQGRSTKAKVNAAQLHTAWQRIQAVVNQPAAVSKKARNKSAKRDATNSSKAIGQHRPSVEPAKRSKGRFQDDSVSAPTQETFAVRRSQK
jgi:putative transposase